MAGTAPLREEEGTAGRDRTPRGQESSGRGKKRAWFVARLSLIALLLGSLAISSGCGKKTPPFIAKKSLDITVLDLRGEWSNGYIVLTGRFSHPEAARETVAGCRVYYAAFPPPEAPCETCPVEFTQHQDFGPEVISDLGFVCRIPGMQGGYAYFFLVNLTGPGGVSGPPSNQILVSAG